MRYFTNRRIVVQTAIDEVDARSYAQITICIIFDEIVIDEFIIAISAVFDEENDVDAGNF